MIKVIWCMNNEKKYVACSLIRRPFGLSKGCPACEDNAVCMPPPCFPPPGAPKPSCLCSSAAWPMNLAASFSSFESLSSSRLPSKALWNHDGSDLGPILEAFWVLKSMIQASSIAFEIVYTQSQFLNDVISVLNGFCFREGFEIS